MKKIFGLGLVIALAGCADMNHDYVFEKNLDQRVDTIATLRAQYRRQQLDHAYDVIRAKLNMAEQYEKHGSPCTDKIGNSTPTPEEQAALRQFTTQRSAFLVQLATLAKPVEYMPERLKSMSENFDRMKFDEESKVTNKLDDLSQGRITYCQFAEANKAVDDEAHKIADGFRTQLKEEGVLDSKRRSGFIPVELLYTSPSPSPQ